VRVEHIADADRAPQYRTTAYGKLTRPKGPEGVSYEAFDDTEAPPA